MIDVRDILEVEPVHRGPGRRPGSGRGGEAKLKKDQPFRRPEGMHRELYALLCADGGKNFNDLAPLLPSDAPGGYKKKLKLGARQVRKWKWTPFTNPARTDNFQLYHWRRETDETTEYQFAKFNKHVPIPTYTDAEYNEHLKKEGWTKSVTDYLFEMCRRFDLRFHVILDRWDRDIFDEKTLEELKERYYEICGTLEKIRRPESMPEPKVFVFDAEGERKRKEQLDRLWKRTPEQVEEEEYLRAELKKIEARKKEREKKTQDLQKLITAADIGQGAQTLDQTSKKLPAEAKKGLASAKKKSGKVPIGRRETVGASQEVFSGIKWPDTKTAGVYVRSQKMKLPTSVGQKKAKAIEQILNQLNLELNQIPTEEMVQEFNELRGDIVLLYEFKSVLTNCDLEIQSLASQYEALTGGQKFPLENYGYKSPETENQAHDSTQGTSPVKSSSLSNVIETPMMPARKRKAALESGNVLKKLKSKELQVHQ